MLHVIFIYKGEPRYGRLLPPKNDPKFGVRFPATITNNAIGVNIDGNIKPITDLQITDITDKIVYNKTEVGTIRPGNCLLIFNKGQVFLEAVDDRPKTYNVKEISELQISTSDLRPKWESLYADFLSNRDLQSTS